VRLHFARDSGVDCKLIGHPAKGEQDGHTGGTRSVPPVWRKPR
jgi:hypothetical protein